VDKVVAALSAQLDDLAALLAPLGDRDWSRPSRCEGWSVADVVLHLAQSDEMALASVRGTYTEAVAAAATGLDPGATVDESAARFVELERGGTGAEILARWRDGAAALRRELDAADPAARVMWVAGDMSVRTLATTRLAETWIHTGDVAAALGRPVAADDRLWHIARLAWRTLPYAFARAGHVPAGGVAFRLAAPGGDTWAFEPDDDAPTTIEGPALDLCNVAGRRLDAADAGLRGEGPDAAAVLALVRTFA
jgi:uncharacterized protein (TIGR03084 family)